MHHPQTDRHGCTMPYDEIHKQQHSHSMATRYDSVTQDETCCTTQSSTTEHDGCEHFLEGTSQLIITLCIVRWFYSSWIHDGRWYELSKVAYLVDIGLLAFGHFTVVMAKQGGGWHQCLCNHAVQWPWLDIGSWRYQFQISLHMYTQSRKHAVSQSIERIVVNIQ